MGFVLGGTERHQDLGTGAVPAGRDGFLGEQHTDVRAVLHRLGADVGDREPSELDRGVIAEHVRHRVRLELRPGPPDGYDRRKEEFVRRLVWHLQDQERHHRFCGWAFLLHVSAPQLSGLFHLSGGAGQQDGVEPTGLGGEVEPDVVLEQTRFLHPRRVDHHGRVAGPVLRPSPSRC